MAQPQLYDFETDPFNSQLATARALRKKGMDEGGNYSPHGIWIGNEGSQFMNALAGSAMEHMAQQGLGGIQRGREAEFQAALSRRPDMMMNQEVPGTPAVTQEFPGADAFGGEGSAPVQAEIAPSVLPSTKRVMKPAAQQQQELMDWSTGMAGIKHPMAQSLAATGLQGAMDIPEKEMARQAAAEIAKELLKQKDADRLAQIEAARVGRPVPAPAVHYETNDRGETTAILRHPDGRLETQKLGPLGKTRAATGGGGGEGGIGKSQFKGMTIDNKPVFFSPTKAGNYVRDEEGNLARYDGIVVPAGQAAKAEVLEQDARDSLPKMDALIAKTKANPDAFGIVPALAGASYIPNSIGSRITSAALSPAERDARVAVMRDAAVLINKIYGAALSRNEAARANTWAPAPDDDYDSTMAKLIGAKAYASELAGRTKGAAAASTTAGPKRLKFNPATGVLE